MALFVEPDVCVSSAGEDDDGYGGIIRGIGLIYVVCRGCDVAIDPAGGQGRVGVAAIFVSHEVLLVVGYGVVLDAGGVEKIFRCDGVLADAGYLREG